MLREVSLASLAVAAGVAMWPARDTRQDAQVVSRAGERSHLVEVMHYGGNLICHERSSAELVGSGNNLLGRRRVEAMNSKSVGEDR